MIGRPSVRAALAITLATGVIVVSIAGAGGGVAAARPTVRPKPPASSHGVRVDSNGTVLKVFTTAQCSVSKSRFTATSTKHGAKLLIRIQPFTGFGHYALKAGTVKGPYVTTFAQYTSPEGVDFSSNFVPPYKVAHGGAIQFAGAGKLIGVGYEPTFNSSGSAYIIFTGVMACRYAAT